MFGLEDDPDAALARVLDMATDELTETRELWAKRLPLCSVHPDVHPLRLGVRVEAVMGACPVEGEVRRVRR